MTIRPLALLALCAFPAVSALPSRASAQTPVRVQPDALKKHLYTIAHDSMGGRDTGSRGNWLTAEYVAAQFKKAGLEPAGENGTYFQTVPFVHVHLDPAARLTFAGKSLKPGFDFLPTAIVDASLENAPAIYSGVSNDSTSWITAEQAAGKLVVFAAPADANGRTIGGALAGAVRNARFRDAAAFAIVALDLMPVDTRAQRLQGRFNAINNQSATSAPSPAPAPPPVTTPPQPRPKPAFLLSARGASMIFGRDAGQLKSGSTGAAVSMKVTVLRDSLAYAARNVVAILRGSDPVAKNTFVALTAHNDHVGVAYTGADHDSVFAYNRVIRGLGADTPDRTPAPAEWKRINAIRDSLRRIRPSYRDSIFNGADDDGTGTVALIEAARTLAAGTRPARSILFVNHIAEERGLVGSGWFTNHPTVERDSIVGEMDMDMVGRGNAWDNPAGGVGYLEVVGARRLSREYGDILEQVNSRQPTPFAFNYEFDQPGHPLQYYCRADHYSYARWSIPAFAVSRGEHADYHQVTDEAEYIDYTVLARVANLATDFARAIASMDHRPKLDAPKGDPNAVCRQ